MVLFLVIVLFVILCIAFREKGETRAFPGTPTSNQTAYERVLDDPEWKKRREEILERDNHECQWCHTRGDYKNPLQVHHKYYVMHNGKYKKPWDYPDKALITLCRNCHEFAHKTKKPPVYFNKR